MGKTEIRMDSLLNKTQFRSTAGRGIAPPNHFPVSKCNAPATFLDISPLKRFLFLTHQVQEKDKPATVAFGKKYVDAIHAGMFDPDRLMQSVPVALKNAAEQSNICLSDILRTLPDSCWALITELGLYQGFGTDWMERSKPKLISKFIYDFMDFHD